MHDVSASGGMRVIIDEDTIRSAERDAAGRALTQHVAAIIARHEETRRSRSGSGTCHSMGANKAWTRAPLLSRTDVERGCGGRTDGRSTAGDRSVLEPESTQQQRTDTSHAITSIPPGMRHGAANRTSSTATSTGDVASSSLAVRKAHAASTAAAAGLWGGDAATTMGLMAAIHREAAAAGLARQHKREVQYSTHEAYREETESPQPGRLARAREILRSVSPKRVFASGGLSKASGSAAAEAEACSPLRAGIATRAVP